MNPKLQLNTGNFEIPLQSNDSVVRINFYFSVLFTATGTADESVELLNLDSLTFEEIATAIEVTIPNSSLIPPP